MKTYLPAWITLVCCGWLAAGLSAQAPVAAYTFSGSAKDATAFANHGAVNGATLATDRFGWANSAMSFDGVQGGVTAPNAGQLNSAQATISFWINPTAFPGQGEAYLLSFGGWQERWKISLPSHGKPVFTTHAGGACCSDMDAGTPLTIGAWTHVVMVHDGAEDIIYYNGARVNTKAVTGDLDATVYPLGIGYDPIDRANYFNGVLDDVMLYDVALGDSEVADLYNQQSVPPIVGDGIVADYRFAGNGADASDFANHASFKGAAFGTDRFGFGSSALECDGATTEVTAANSAQLNSANATISFWVRPNSFPGTGEVFILSQGGWQERWKISLPSHGKPVFTTHAGGACCSDMDSGTPLELGAWTHVVMTHNGAEDVIYFNGSPVSSKVVTGDLDPTNYPLGIGYNPIDGGGWFDGAIDELEIYNVALDAAQVAALYADQAAYPGTPSSLVADYALNGTGDDDTELGNDAELGLTSFGTKNRFGWSNNALSGPATAANSPALQSDYTTISFWVNPSEFPGTGEVFLLSNGGWQERWKVSLPSHGKPVFTTHAGGACCSDMDSGTPLTIGAWTHVVMVHDGSDDIIYFNGVPVNTKSSPGALDKTRYPLGIGYDPIDNAGYFVGSLDDVQIYDVALSAQEVADLYTAQSAMPVITDPLVANYTFDGNSRDASAFNNHASAAIPAADRFGKSNKAAGFRGAQEVTAANADQLNSPYTTVSFWVKPNTLPGNGEVFLLSYGGWQERWKISLPAHGKPVWTTNHTNGISDMDSGDPNVLVPGTWTHVVMVHDGAQDKIYFNGGIVATKDVAGDLNSTTAPLGIGFNPIDGGNWLDGDMDEVRIYNVALDDAAIAALYAEQSTPVGGGDVEAPCAPLNLAAEVSFNNVNLTWLPAMDDVGVVAYNVYVDGSLAATTTATNQYFAQLIPLTDYRFGVTAVDAAGNESLPTTINATTGPDETPDTTPPTAPGNLSGSASFNSVLLTWDASTDDTKVDGYIVWVDGTYFDSLPGNQLSVLVTGLEPETAYSFEVAAFDLAGNLSELSELTLSTTEPLDTGEPGLVAHYPFDGDANDATPYANHGAIGGNPVFEVATHAHGGGMAIKFDGEQDSVLAPNAVQLLSDYTTVSFWIRVDNINVADAEAYVMDFGHWDQRWKISLPQHRKIVWTTNSKNQQFPNFISDMDSGDGNELIIGVWSYVTMVHDGTNDIIYKDGVKANMKPADGTLNSTGRKLAMGNNPIEGGQYFPGALDNVKIYNRALTEEEAIKLYQDGTLATGVDDPTFADLYIERVFPNPTADELTVRHTLGAIGPMTLRVFDLQGRQLDAIRLGDDEVANGQFTIRTGKYPAGTYSLNFVANGRSLGSVPFIKQ